MKILSELPPFTYNDEFSSEEIRLEFMKRREFIIRRKRGEIPPRKRKERKFKAVHQTLWGKCPECKRTRPLTTNYEGKIMCSSCLLNTL